MRNDIVFCTIAIGSDVLESQRVQFKGANHYIQVTNILAKSVLKNTNNDLVVVTDCPDDIIKHERIIVFDINTLTNEPHIVKGYFNYHLKRFAMQKGFEQNKKYTIYVDCDVFIEEPLEDAVFDYLDNTDFDVLARFGSHVDPTRDHWSVKHKLLEYGDFWKDEYKMARLSNETFFCFKQSDKQKLFIESWNKVANRSLQVIQENDFYVYADSYYISTSIIDAQMEPLQVSEHTSKIIEQLRIIHSDFVNSLYIEKLYPYNYNELFRRFD